MTELNTSRPTWLLAALTLLASVTGCNSLANRGLLSKRSNLTNNEFPGRLSEITSANAREQSVQQGQPPVRPAIAEEPTRQPVTKNAVVPASYSNPETDPSLTSAAFEEPMLVAEAMSEPLVSYEGMAPMATCSAGGCGGCSSCSSSPECAAGGCGECGPCVAHALRMQNVQEYIYDGGDLREDATVLKDWNVTGIDPTDTVGYYETVNGTVCVKPSNRVAIYAPRFGSVRQVTGAILASKAVGTQRILTPIKAVGIEEHDIAGAVVQPLAPEGQRQVSLIDRFMDSTGGVRLVASLPLQRMSDAVPTLGAVDVAGTTEIFEDQPAIIGRVLQNAPTLYIIESLAVEVDGVQAAVMRDRQQPDEVVLYDIPDKCSLRISKTASHTIADSGDIVRFTLRFDNAGVKPIGNVVLTDSLSPRLEFVEGSQQSSVETRFSALPNGSGSKILRWEIVEPLEKYAGGVITFDCRVR